MRSAPVAEALAQCPCPRHYPDWHDQDVDLAGQCVHDMPIAAFFNMPLAYESYLDRQSQNIQQLGLTELWPNFVLTRTKFWGGQIMRLLTNSTSPSRFVHYLPPPFYVHAMLHPGGIGTVAKTLQAQQIKLFDQGRRAKELYLAHLTCPKCEEGRGGEKIMVIRRWAASKALTGRIKKPDAKTA